MTYKELTDLLRQHVFDGSSFWEDGRVVHASLCSCWWQYPDVLKTRMLSRKAWAEHVAALILEEEAANP